MSQHTPLKPCSLAYKLHVGHDVLNTHLFKLIKTQLHCDFVAHHTFPQIELLIYTCTLSSRKFIKQETYTSYGKMLVLNFYDFLGGKISEAGTS